MQKAKHGVIATVIPQHRMIKIMCQADHETVAIWHGRDFNERKSRPSDEIAQQRYMPFQGRLPRVGRRLADGQ